MPEIDLGAPDDPVDCDGREDEMVARRCAEPKSRLSDPDRLTPLSSSLRPLIPLLMRRSSDGLRAGGELGGEIERFSSLPGDGGEERGPGATAIVRASSV